IAKPIRNARAKRSSRSISRRGARFSVPPRASAHGLAVIRRWRAEARRSTLKRAPRRLRIMPTCRATTVGLLLALAPLGRGADAGDMRYAGAVVCGSCHQQIAAGAVVCGSCHQQIAATQAKTAMAKTWHGAVTPLLPPGYHGRAQEGAAKVLQYEIERQSDGFIFSALMPDGVKTTLPVNVVMGGERHGLSFLLSIEKLDSIPLERPALIEARYVYNTPNQALAI